MRYLRAREHGPVLPQVEETTEPALRTRVVEETPGAPAGPDEGIITMGLLVALVVPIAWSIQDAAWVLGRSQLTEFLTWAAILGVAWGILGAKVGWGRWRTHLLGAVMAALIIPIMVGTTLIEGGNIHDWFMATAGSTVEAALDLTVRGSSLTRQYGHFLLVFGVIVWGTGQFAGFAALGHRRPLGAIFVTGLVLLANMAVTIRDQLLYLVIFSVASLFLLVRLHADEERLAWLRRRIGDPSPVTGLYLRGGSAFVVAAVAGSLLLTNVAASAPLAGAFRGIDQKLVDFGQSIQKYLPFGGGGTRISGASFGKTATIQGRWVTDATPVLVIRVPHDDDTKYYWRTYAYDTFTGNQWLVTESAAVDRPANSTLLDGLVDEIPDPKLRHEVPIEVESVGYGGVSLFFPDAPKSIDIDTRLTVVGTQGEFGGLEAPDGWQSYKAVALVPTRGETGFTANKLRAAGTAYPAEIKRMYTAVPKDVIGPKAAALLAEIRAKAKANSPYDMAIAAESFFRSDAFHYQTDVTGLDCTGLGTVECFATYRQGFCEYYATTMAILLRQAGIPARFVEGYLPGERSVRTGVESILKSNSHAWVEVYFPGYGWYKFDPTGGNLTTRDTLIEGSPRPSRPPTSPRPSASSPIDLGERIRGAGGSTTTPSGGSPAGVLPFIAIGLLLLSGVGWLAFVAYRRGPRNMSQPDAIWTGVGRLAGRFGWAPRPTQTPFEYAAALGDVLPIARPELHVVATAKVESVYGRRFLDDRGLAAVREAHRRLRVLMLRLLFRRPRRSKKSRK